MHYLKKIEALEVELKRRDTLIQSYMTRITELNHKIAGDNDRVRLMNKIQDQLQQLKQEKVSLAEPQLSSQSLGSLELSSRKHPEGNVLKHPEGNVLSPKKGGATKGNSPMGVLSPKKGGPSQ